MKARRRLLAPAILILSPCCSLLVEESDYVGRTRDGGSMDGAPEVAPADAALGDAFDAAPGDADAGSVNLLPNGGFELSGPACTNGWVVETGLAATSDTAKTGSRGCKLCGNTRLVQTPRLAAKDGTYVVQAYIRTSPGEPPAGAYLRLQLIAGDGGIREVVPAGTDPTDAWQEQQASIVNTGTNQLVVTLIVSSAPDTCAVFDDVVLTHVPPP